ncbi:MAG: enoyl-CoA hydratase-related protein, partial [Myxococcota bacterium]|nr:enoyl-CoA hydratase-related protein [Myxococcota bacterium]
METLRAETEEGVRSLVLCRPEAYNTITPTLRDELAAAIDAADVDPEVRVILLRAEGPAFCAGYALDWGTAAQAAESAPDPSRRAWDSVSDMRMIGSFVDVYMKLWYARKPTIAAVQGWCIGGGTD